jgi:hypothetical protein
MKKLLLAALVAGAMVPSLTTAHADPLDEPQGRKCGFNSATDVSAESPGVQAAVVQGGPLEIGTHTGHLVCTIQVNSNQHNATDGWPSVGPDGTGAIYLAPTNFSYNATATDNVYMCTRVEFTDGSPTLYWTSGEVAGTGVWGTDSSAACSLATTIDPNPFACPFLLAIDARLGTDLAGIWQDCGPFEPIV